MLVNHLKVMSQEDREAIAIARQIKKEYAEANYINSFSDEPYWRNLASYYDVRMPVRSAGPHETKYVRRIAKKVGVDIDLFVQSTGFNTLKAFCEANNNYPAWAIVGLYLEFSKETLSLQTHF
jgi:hypothetical protein